LQGSENGRVVTIEQNYRTIYLFTSIIGDVTCRNSLSLGLVFSEGNLKSNFRLTITITLVKRSPGHLNGENYLHSLSNKTVTISQDKIVSKKITLVASCVDS
jgi:hypothetical protein